MPAAVSQLRVDGRHAAAAGARDVGVSLSFAAALPRGAERFLRAELHGASQYEHISQRLCPQSAALRFSFDALSFCRGGKTAGSDGEGLGATFWGPHSGRVRGDRVRAVRGGQYAARTKVRHGGTHYARDGISAGA